MIYFASILVALLVCHIDIAVNAKLCPNEKDSCPEFATCCVLLDGTFGCCPYTGAQCCEDRIHCCPQGSKCSAKRQSCDLDTLGGYNNDILLRWMVPVYDQKEVKKTTIVEEPLTVEEDLFPPKGISNSIAGFAKVKKTACPDGNECQDRATCCQLPEGSYGCCPYKDATCCVDKVHCCPSGYSCDLTSMQCTKKTWYGSNSEIIGWRSPSEVPIYNLRTEDFEAPSACAPMNLCSLSGYVCCSDGASEHCCPPGTVCSSGKNACVQERKSKNALSFVENNERLPSGKLLSPRDPVQCPDKTEYCPDANTCCSLASGGYGCCPMPQATCCSDQLHCCPNGYVCSDNGCERMPYLHMFNRPIFVERTFIR